MSISVFITEATVVIGNWGWPEWSIAVMDAVLLFYYLYVEMHPQVEEFHASIILCIVDNAIVHFIYFCGGFYDVFELPQYAMIILDGFCLLVYIKDSVECHSVDHSQRVMVTTSGFMGVAYISTTLILLAMGGFFA